MNTDAWRERLEAAFEASGKSARSISLASGNGPGYLHSVLKEGKEPGVSNLIAVCEKIPVSFIWVMFGVDVDDDDIPILHALRDETEKRNAIIALIGSKVTS